MREHNRWRATQTREDRHPASTRAADERHLTWAERERMASDDDLVGIPARRAVRWATTTTTFSPTPCCTTQQGFDLRVKLQPLSVAAGLHMSGENRSITKMASDSEYNILLYDISALKVLTV